MAQLTLRTLTPHELEEMTVEQLDEMLIDVAHSPAKLGGRVTVGDRLGGSIEVHPTW